MKKLTITMSLSREELDLLSAALLELAERPLPEDIRLRAYSLYLKTIGNRKAPKAVDRIYAALKVGDEEAA